MYFPAFCPDVNRFRGAQRICKFRKDWEIQKCARCVFYHCYAICAVSRTFFVSEHFFGLVLLRNFGISTTLCIGGLRTLSAPFFRLRLRLFCSAFRLQTGVEIRGSMAAARAVRGFRASVRETLRALKRCPDSRHKGTIKGRP